MSLVHEALQKAEREKQRKTAPSTVVVPAKPVPLERPVSETPKPPTPAPAPAAKMPPWFLTVMISCVSLVAIVAIVFLVIRATTSQPPAPSPVAHPAAAAPARTEPASKPVAETPKAPTPAVDASPFKISGIMKDPEGKYCAVINGRVVYEEHYIDGAIIKRIERDRVTLEIGGQETVLRLF